MALVRKKLVPYLEHLAARPSKIATTDSADDLGNLIDSIKLQYANTWPRSRVAALVRPVANQIATYQANQLNNQLDPIVAVDVVGSESWLPKAVDEFTSENVALIKSIPEGFLGDLEKDLAREIADGARWESLATTIEERYGVSESRAELIARDQTNKFYGDLNRVRQQDLGLTSFVWRTMNDERVRPEHEARDGETYDWSDPPDGETPGEPVNCRCWAEPIIDQAED